MQFGRRDDVYGQWRLSQCDSFLLHRIEIGVRGLNLKVNSFDSEAGSFDLTGNGLESISCLGKSFSKSGQDLVADCT